MVTRVQLCGFNQETEARQQVKTGCLICIMINYDEKVTTKLKDTLDGILGLREST